MDAGDHRAVGGVERREQASRAVPDVVVGALLGHARHHRERRLGSGQRLHLGLLVHAQHHGGLGRVQIQPDDVIDLFHEQRVVGQLEPVGAMRLELERLPDPPDRGLGQSAPLRHLRPRPVRRIRSAWTPTSPRSRPPPARHVIVAGGPGAAHRPARPSAHPRTATPLAHRHRGHALPRSDILVGQPLRAAQHDPRPQRQRLRRLRRRDQRTSCSRSSAVNSNDVFGRPFLGIHHSMTYPANLRRTTLGGEAERG